ncbi:hypothetical protein [Leptolyngbya ohadii]|uniref:hypothetical protein n=1 Tax=Leptolyngbya ohadii TaxID=1962290 RepID=UPI000B59C543|nr:hypothetical protein [Leptolyngbya ohadii]
MLASQRFDLVFFSSTIFPVMILGDRWQRRFRVPYILDFQDPWRVEAAPTHQRPGGRLRYAVDKFLAKNLEPRAVKRVSHIISESELPYPICKNSAGKRIFWQCSPIRLSIRGTIASANSYPTICP